VLNAFFGTAGAADQNAAQYCMCTGVVCIQIQRFPRFICGIRIVAGKSETICEIHQHLSVARRKVNGLSQVGNRFDGLLGLKAQQAAITQEVWVVGMGRQLRIQVLLSLLCYLCPGSKTFAM
jgi:hypothetical protein